MNLSDVTNELSERGIWWQVAGFTIVALASVIILAEYSGSDVRAYRYFEIAATKLYWAFIIPLAGLFEGVRKMFEKASEIRAAQRAKMQERWTRVGREKGREEGRKEGIKEGQEEGRRKARQETASRMQEAYERFGIERDGMVTLPNTPEVVEFMFPPEESGELS